MAADQAKLKLNKRKIRVERCKNISSSGISRSLPRTTAGERASKRGSGSRPDVRNKEQALRPSAAGIPQGDPTLGDRLRRLDKDARRAAKAADPSRQARRLAKKKARHALENAGLRTDKGKGAGAVLGNMKALGKPKIKAKVSRVRSSKSAAKRNVKK
jgi:nucleolar protein 12